MHQGRTVCFLWESGGRERRPCPSPAGLRGIGKQRGPSAGKHPAFLVSVPFRPALAPGHPGALPGGRVREEGRLQAGVQARPRSPAHPGAVAAQQPALEDTLPVILKQLNGYQGLKTGQGFRKRGSVNCRPGALRVVKNTLHGKLVSKVTATGFSPILVQQCSNNSNY